MTTEENEKLVKFILNCGGIDGSHHKQWVLDQILRDTLKDDYEKTIREFEGIDKNGDKIYEWDIGIAP